MKLGNPAPVLTQRRKFRAPADSFKSWAYGCAASADLLQRAVGLTFELVIQDAGGLTGHCGPLDAMVWLRAHVTEGGWPVGKELNGARSAARLFANAKITVVALLLVFAAFDDITTDNATSFRVEYTLLVACAGWLLFVGWWLIRGGHRTLGFISLVVLAGALWAQHAIRPRMVPGLRPEYIVMTTAYFWFWAVAGSMLWLGSRPSKERERQAM